METDLRAVIENNLAASDANSLFTSDWLDKVTRRRAKDYGNQPARSVASLIPYMDFADSYEVLLRHRKEFSDDLQTVLQNVAPKLQKVTEIRNRVAHSRPMEIDDLPFMIDLAKELCEASAFPWNALRVTMSKLEEHPAHVLGLTIELQSDPDRAPQHNLPVPDFDETGFFGRQKELARIKRVLKGPYPVVSILGDGGIGKTSIALKAAYELLDDPEQPFDAFVWVTAKATALTAHEIERISGAIEDSLGLFARAATELGGPGSAENPVAEVLAYLESFRILLILDNLETVLDQRLRNFLLDLPIGSKVIITSRIGLGIENPINLEPISNDDSVRLIRALARTRSVTSLMRLNQEKIRDLATGMGGHPAYIRWFVAGVQAGRRPEEMLSNNELLLDFCMSNVYDYLNENARFVLRCMQALPGPRNQAELAFLNNFLAHDIQATLLELITTNFVQMQNRELAQSFETTYQLSDFGRQYLDKRHPITMADRGRFVSRNRKLLDLGTSLRAASRATPYDPETLDIRGPGDFNVARLLREAFRALTKGSVDEALRSCKEAQVLAPLYHEAWRVEAHVQTARGDFSSALSAYERAHELASSSPTLNYFFGRFMLDEGANPSAGLELLQKAANTEAAHPVVFTNIAWAHLQIESFEDAVSAASHALSLRPHHQEGAEAVSIGMRAAFYGARRHLENLEYEASAEMVETMVAVTEETSVELFFGEPADRILQMIELATSLMRRLDDDFLIRKLKDLVPRLREQLRRVDVDLLERRLGTIVRLVTDKFYGFISERNKTYFFHLSDMTNEYEWDYLDEGTSVGFFPDDMEPKGPHARQLRWLG
ncbi:NB-ARC domain-containing protein [Actinomadura sp. 21ATH]|uniref:NB-ARC domain-containing protein n=1 Tax=Actinomadura sp. 21ATH TaxID=1735444 RepID=UPI0035C20C3F